MLNRKLIIAATVFLWAASLAHAQNSLGLGNAEAGAGPSTFILHYMPWFEPVVSFIAAKQQEFYRALTKALVAMKEDSGKLWWLIGISFLYGVFHAAGPGHGKAVISAYMIANEVELRRGVFVSFLSSFAQGVTAVLAAGAGYLLLRGMVTMNETAKVLEVSSFAMIMAFGFYLLYLKTIGLFRRPLMAFSDPGLALAGTGHDQGHHAGDLQHDHTHHHHGHAHGRLHHADANPHGHAHTHSGEVCSVCGHAHAPTPDMVAGEKFSIASAWAAIVAVGLRPCTGALLVLGFTFTHGLYLGGFLSVFAMSLGTAITVATLAILAVTAKDVALKLAEGSSMAGRLMSAIEILGALFIILFGFTMLMASLQG